MLETSQTHDLSEALIDLLRSGDYERVERACVLIQDIILIAPKHNLGIPFRDAFLASPIVPVLERLVLADNYFIRRDAILTLGKTGSLGSVKVLHDAFSALRETDPLILLPLVREIWWLEEHKSWSLIDRMMASQRYTTRWAALGILSEWSGDGEIQDTKQRCYALLRGDECPLIRAEAEYAYQKHLSTLKIAEKNERPKNVGQDKPSVSFADIEIWFGNYLREHHLTDYSVDDMERFISNDMVRFVRGREAYQTQGVTDNQRR